jgi:hypothetical protein
VKKLTSKKGETIAETLVALTIAAIGLVLLASMIQSSSRMIASSSEQVKRYVAEENRIAVQPPFEEVTVDPGETSVKDGSVGKVKIIPTGDGASTEEILLTDSSKEEIDVVYYVNTQAQGETVELYNKAIISYKPGNGENPLDSPEG